MGMFGTKMVDTPSSVQLNDDPSAPLEVRIEKIEKAIEKFTD